MKPDQEFIKKYTELYGEDIQFSKGQDDRLFAGTVGEDGKFYAVDSISAGGKKSSTTPKKKSSTPTSKQPKGKHSPITAGVTPQAELFNAVEKALKEQFNARIQAGHNPFEEFNIPTFFKKD